MNVRLLVCLFMTVIPSWVGAQMGPLFVTNRFPPHLMFLVPRPDSPRTRDLGQGRFSLGADYLSVFAQDQSREWSAVMDMEAEVLFYAQPGICFLSDPHYLGARVKTSTVFGLLLGGEYLFSPKTSLLAQANFYTPPVRNTGIRQLDQDTLELSLGIIRTINPRLALEAAFSEDLTRAAPDFTVHVRLTCRFGDTD